MTKNRRYEEHFDRLNDLRIAQAAGQPSPLTFAAAGVWPGTVHMAGEGRAAGCVGVGELAGCAGVAGRGGGGRVE